jgi:hypothetical protein
MEVFMSEALHDDFVHVENPMVSMAVTCIFMALGLIACLAFLVVPVVAHEKEHAPASAMGTMIPE